MLIRSTQVMEQKGLDIVRRDWCPLSKDCGNVALAAVLSGRGQEEVVADIHAHLRDVAGKVRAGQVRRPGQGPGPGQGAKGVP